MQSTSLKFRAGFLVLLLGVSITACTKPAATTPDLVGKWMAIAREPGIPGRSGQVGFVIELFDDHTVMLPSGRRDWNLLGDGHVRITAPGLTMHGSVRDDVMTIVMADGTKVVFKKVR